MAVNDLTDAETLAQLTKYDSTLGRYPGTVEATGDGLKVDGDDIKVFAEKDPADIDWAAHDVDVVLESTGFFTDAEKAKAHLGGSVKKVADLRARPRTRTSRSCWASTTTPTTRTTTT